MKRILGFIALVFTACFLFIGCNDKNDLTTTPEEKTINDVQLDSYTNLIDNDERNQMSAVMNDANLTNVSTFMNWVKEYNKIFEKDKVLQEGWNPLAEINYDPIVLSNLWTDKYEEDDDTNSRITTFLLLEDNLKGETTEEASSYTLLDIDKIESGEIRYRDLQNDLGLYRTVFNDVSVENATTEEEFHNAYPNKWAEKKVVFPEGKISMISVVMNDPDSKLLFIGHSGVLIDEGQYVLFIEKIAETMPYQVTKLKDRKALSDMLLNRSDYHAGDEECDTFILENNAMLKF